jgi:hypothetical protein
METTPDMGDNAVSRTPYTKLPVFKGLLMIVAGRARS